MFNDTQARKRDRLLGVRMNERMKEQIKLEVKPWQMLDYPTWNNSFIHIQSSLTVKVE